MPTWEALIPVIVKYGVPFAETVWKKWTSGTPPTQADFDDLRAQESISAKDQMKARLVAAGIPLDDPKAIQLIEMAS